MFAHRGTTPDDLALQRAGADARESVVRAGALGGVEQAVLALAGCAASVIACGAGPDGARASVLVDSARLAIRLLERPLRNWRALAGMLTFWAAEMFAVWAGLAAFGFTMNEAALVTGFCTGMVFARRVAPLAGAGILTVILSLALWHSGAPLAVAVAGISPIVP